MNQNNAPLALGTEQISKLLRQYALPAIIAMTASSLYNVTDSVFIGHGVGPMAIAGLALSGPLMNLSAAFGTLVGVGAAVLVSVKLGQKDYKGANRVLGNELVLNVILGLLVAVLCLIFLDPILYFFGASAQTIDYAHSYMTIILYGNVITHLYFGLNAVIRSSGFPKLAMTFTLISVGINVILDPIFIFCFHWGIAGAAWATVIAQTVSLVGQIYHISKKNNILHLQKGIFKLKKSLIGEIFSIGLSPFLMNACSCLLIILINHGLKRYGGDLSIGAMGIVNNFAFIFVMIVMGFNQGMQPITGYNFGAKQYSRVTDVMKLTMICATCVTTAGFLACELFPSFIAKFFTSDEKMIALVVYGMRIDFALFPIIGFQMVAANFFTSIGMAKKAIFLSLTRQLLFLMPCLLILPPILGAFGVWVSLPISDFLSTFVTALLLRAQFRKFHAQNQAQITTQKSLSENV